MSWTVREKEYEDLGTPLYGKCGSKKLGLFFVFFLLGIFINCLCWWGIRGPKKYIYIYIYVCNNVCHCCLRSNEFCIYMCVQVQVLIYLLLNYTMVVISKQWGQSVYTRGGNTHILTIVSLIKYLW